MTGHKFKNAFKDADIAREPIGLMLTLLPGMVSSATIDYIKGNLLTYLPFVFKFFLQVCGWSGLEYLLTPPLPPLIHTQLWICLHFKAPTSTLFKSDKSDINLLPKALQRFFAAYSEGKWQNHKWAGNAPHAHRSNPADADTYQSCLDLFAVDTKIFSLNVGITELAWERDVGRMRATLVALKDNTQERTEVWGSVSHWHRS